MYQISPMNWLIIFLFTMFVFMYFYNTLNFEKYFNNVKKQYKKKIYVK